MSTPFDPELFMNTNFAEANATKVIPCPAGEYNGIIEDVKTRVLDSGQVLMDVVWNIDDVKAKEKSGRDKLTVRQSVWLDFENGNLAFGEGKNVGLGRLRAALNQNAAGKPWSPAMLKGQVAKVKVTHRPDKTTGDLYDQVSAVSALR
jgi:hypothetical protein